MISKNESFFRTAGLIKDETNSINILTSRNSSEKRIKINNKKIKYRSELMGVFPTVIFSPDTIDVISGGSQARLSLFNRLFCTVDKIYTTELIKLEKIIKQKKLILKNNDHTQIDFWNNLFAEKAHKVWEKRHKLWSEFEKCFNEVWVRTFPQKEATIKYVNHQKETKDEILKKLTEIKNQEFLNRRLLYGPQKDEFIFYYNDIILKDFGSQGEKKIFHYVLKLAEGNYIKKKMKKTPVLLLDDLFAKIDNNKINKILNSMLNNFQVFITSTDTYKDGIENWIKKDTKLIKI